MPFSQAYTSTGLLTVDCSSRITVVTGSQDRQLRGDGHPFYAYQYNLDFWYKVTPGSVYKHALLGKSWRLTECGTDSYRCRRTYTANSDAPITMKTADRGTLYDRSCGVVRMGAATTCTPVQSS